MANKQKQELKPSTWLRVYAATGWVPRSSRASIDVRTINRLTPLDDLRAELLEYVIQYDEAYNMETYKPTFKLRPPKPSRG